MQQQKFLMIIIAIAAISGMLYGYDLGIITAAFLVLPKYIEMDATMMGFLGAAVLAGGAITILVAGQLADYFGRRFMIIVATVIFLLGVALLTFAKTYEVIIAGRLIQGVGVGIVTIVVPLYLAEILPDKVRGRGMTVFQLLLACGIFFANIVGFYFTETENWRAMFLSSGAPAVVLLLASFILPESPRWLAMKGKNAEAFLVLQRIMSKEDAEKQLQEIKANLSTVAEKAPIIALFSRKYLMVVMLVFSIAILNQLTGVNSFLQYSGLILVEAGLESNAAAMLGSSILTSVIIFVPLVAMFLLILGEEKKYWQPVQEVYFLHSYSQGLLFGSCLMALHAAIPLLF